MFGCISGSSVADTAAIGSVMIPQMIKEGYPRLFAVNVTIAGSLQPLLIPPSHNAVIYSLAAGGTISVAHLFIAGVIPGLLLGLSLMILCFYIAHRDNFPKGEVIPLRQALRIAAEAIWGLFTVFIIIGGILSGVFTPTESAAVACIYSFLVTMFIYRDYKWSELPLLVGRVVRTVGMVMIMIGFSVAFGYMMAIMQIPAKITQFFLTVADNKYTFLLLVNILLLVLGTFMDLAPMLLICTPIFLPVIKTFGIDPVHFGMIMILNLGIGLLTPPVGPTLVVGCVIGKVTMEAVSKSIMIFYIPMLIVLVHGDLHPGAVAVAAERCCSANSRAARYAKQNARSARTGRFALPADVAGTLPSLLTYLAGGLKPPSHRQLTKGHLTMPKKFKAESLEGGPGASHENKKQPEKSKPHAELKKLHPKQGNTKRTAQGKSGKGEAPWR